MDNQTHDNQDYYFLLMNELEFHPKEHLLRSADNGTEVSLFSAASRCLEILLINHGQIVTQREMMHFSWVEQGLTVSQNAFYQNIHMLRNTLSNFLPGQEIIVTLKRSGLTVPESVSVKKLEKMPEIPGEQEAERTSDASYEVELYGSSHIQHSEVSPVYVRNNRPVRFIWTCAWILIAVAASLIIYAKKIQGHAVGGSDDGPFSNYVLFKKIKSGCDVFINPTSGEVNSNKKLLSVTSSGCKGYGRAYVTLFEGSMRTSVMYCSPSEIDDLSCVSEYYARSQK